MAFQDDAREKTMAQALNIVIPEGRSRIATDALFPLEIGGEWVQVPFELKSMSKPTAATARDVGLPHINRWRTMHWAFGYFAADGTTMTLARYGSPEAMAPWLDRLESYIRPDLVLAESLPTAVDDALLTAVAGDWEVYPLISAQAIHKKQWTLPRYRQEADSRMEDGSLGYSRDKMLEILRERARYVLARGATLNNPSITKGFMEKLPSFTGHRWAPEFEALVRPVVEARRMAGLPY